jgi:hypothetical protein
MQYMTEASRWSEALSIAEEQWGLLTKQQIESTGLAWSTLSRQVRRGVIERVAHGVYRVRGTADIDHLELRAAWLQLNPALPAWARGPADGVVSHRSAAALYGIGHLPADRHEFILPGRKQTRRPDVRLHRGQVDDSSTMLRGLPVTPPHRIAAGLLSQREDLAAVAEVVTDSLRAVYDYPAAIARAIAPRAGTYQLPPGDGLGLLRWLLTMSGDPDRDRWLAQAEADWRRTA